MIMPLWWREYSKNVECNISQPVFVLGNVYLLSKIIPRGGQIISSNGNYDMLALGVAEGIPLLEIMLKWKLF